MTRFVLIFPMNPNPTHQFGRLSGYIDAYWLYAQRMKKDGNAPFAYLSHLECHGDPRQCSDGYIWHNSGLRWHFDIEKEGSFVDKNLKDVMKTKWAKYVPPFRRYEDFPYWFLLKNLRKMREEKAILGHKVKGGCVLDVNQFWREPKGSDPRIHSSIFRSSYGAPWVVNCALEYPSPLDLQEEIDPLRALMLNTIIQRGGISEQTIEETFLLTILLEGFQNKKVDAIWEQEGFMEDDASRFRFDLAFRLEDGRFFAVEFKKGFGEEAPLQLKNYIIKSPILKTENPIPIIVCAVKTQDLIRKMKRIFHQKPWKVIEFRPKVNFEDVTEQC